MSRREHSMEVDRERPRGRPSAQGGGLTVDGRHHDAVVGGGAVGRPLDAVFVVSDELRLQARHVQVH